MSNYSIRLPTLFPEQEVIFWSKAKRKVIRAGRRGGKTVLAADIALEGFIEGKRILYAAPTLEQVDTFWNNCKDALVEPIEAGVFYKNESRHIIEKAQRGRLRAKTAWNAETMRGDYADLLIMDEFQLMAESTWDEVGAPMLLDNDGDAIFIYTPPSLHSHRITKAHDPLHAAKLYKKAMEDTSGRWAAFHYASNRNPYISSDALKDITKDMSSFAYRQEILAEDIDEAPGALWHRRKTLVGTQWVLGLEENRVFAIPELRRIAVGVDPSGSATGDACGIIAAGIDIRSHHYTLEDNSIQGSPDMWAREVIKTYQKLKADVIVAEKNYGGEMVEKVIRDTNGNVNIRLVTATHGKAIRAEPISAMTERGTDHMVGEFPALENELCLWTQGDKSPNRLDAKVIADTELMSGGWSIAPS
jgi:hypothetical protein